MIPYGSHTVNTADALKVALQLRFGTLTQGKKIEEFESRFAKFVGSNYAVCVSSGTAGLHLAVRSLEIPKGSEVATTPVSFVASSNSIIYSELKPKFIDVEASTINLNPNILAQELNQGSKIKAVLAVHFAGLPSDMRKIHQIGKNYSLRIIEDAAHAFGARYESGEHVGSCRYSDLTVFSFHPVKTITSGEGGMITTNSEDIYRKLLKLRSHGINKLNDSLVSNLYSKTKSLENPWYYEMQNLGYNYRLTDFQAVLGISQLKKVTKFINRRFDLASHYREEFKQFKNLQVAQKVASKYSANHIFPIRINFAQINLSKSELMVHLRKLGIMTQVHYIPIPLHPYYQMQNFNTKNIPEAMTYYYESLSIPLFPRLTNRVQARIIEILRKTIG